MNRLSFFLVMALVCLHATACIADDVARAPGEDDIAAVKNKWLERHCSAGLNRDQFQLCLRAYVANMEPLDPNRREQFGEQYDPQKWYACMQERGGNYGFSNCEKFRLRRIENPEYWPYPNVPALKWPEPPTPSVYEQLKKKYLVVTAKDYFEALCTAEAGEFIFKAFENVEGLYEIRPSRRSTDREFEDLYVLEDPWNASSSRWRTFQSDAKYWDSFGDHFVQPNHGKFNFSETPVTTDGKTSSRIVRVYRNADAASGRSITSVLNGKFVQVPYVVAWKEAGNVAAHFGFTWRGIQRPHDRELNIAGSELAIVDLRSNELIALRRDFVQTGKSRNTPTGVNWETAAPCGWPRIVLPSDFINRVLKPRQN